MKAIPNRLRVVLFSLAALLSAGVGLAGYYYFQLTADVEAPGLEAPNNLDGKELERKLKLLDDALKTARRGFVRVSEVEINSYLHAHYPDQPLAGDPPSGRDGCRLIKCRADLTPTDVIFYSWIQTRWHGRAWNLCWQRTAVLRRASDHWEFVVKSMQVGRQRIPVEFWPRVSQFFQAADQPLQEQYAWLTRQPALLLKPSELNQQPELRLYTFPDPTALREAQP